MDETGFTFPPKVYDFLKYLALVVLPAIAALILGLGVVLAWSGATPTAGIITLVDTFLGALLGRSSSNFKAQDPQAIGDLVFGTDPDGNAQISRLTVHQENPVFTAGSKVYLNVVRDIGL
jgi:hypothetical protein